MSYSKAYYNRMVQVIDHAQFERAVDLVEVACKAGQEIFTLGNGGNGSTTSHFICDWNKRVVPEGGTDSGVADALCG